MQVEERGSKTHSEHVIDGCATPAAGAAQYDLAEVADALRSLSQRVAEDDGELAALDGLVLVALERVPGARWDLDDVAGRGLAIIDAVSREWGVDIDPDVGKSVWAAFDVGQAGA